MTHDFSSEQLLQARRALEHDALLVKQMELPLLQAVLDGWQRSQVRDSGLMAAAAAHEGPGAIERLELIARNGVDLSQAHTASDHSLLFVAHSGTIDWLVQHACDPADDAFAVLDQACCRCTDDDDEDIASEAFARLHKLLEVGVSPNVADEKGHTVLATSLRRLRKNPDPTFAKQWQAVIGVLLEGGADPNACGVDAIGQAVMNGRPPLLAPEEVSVKVASMLLRHGARCDVGSAEAVATVSLAIEIGNPEPLERLHERGHDLQALKFGTDPSLSLLEQVWREDSVPVLSWLLDAKVVNSADVQVVASQDDEDNACDRLWRSYQARREATQALSEAQAPRPSA